VLVGGVVSDDQVNVQIRWDAVVQLPQDSQKLPMTMPRLAFCEYRPGDISPVLAAIQAFGIVERTSGDRIVCSMFSGLPLGRWRPGQD
jgi:hypothetical protein